MGCRRSYSSCRVVFQPRQYNEKVAMTCNLKYCCRSMEGVNSACAPNASLYCVFMSDTAGVVWRAFSARPTWLGGSGKPTVDKWTKNILLACEQQSLINAGLSPCDAANQATCDVNSSLQMNCADPCKPATPPLSLTTMILIIVAAAIVLIVGTNAFVAKEL